MTTIIEALLEVKRDKERSQIALKEESKKKELEDFYHDEFLAFFEFYLFLSYNLTFCLENMPQFEEAEIKLLLIFLIDQEDGFHRMLAARILQAIIIIDNSLSKLQFFLTHAYEAINEKFSKKESINFDSMIYLLVSIENEIKIFSSCDNELSSEDMELDFGAFMFTLVVESLLMVMDYPEIYSCIITVNLQVMIPLLNKQAKRCTDFGLRLAFLKAKWIKEVVVDSLEHFDGINHHILQMTRTPLKLIIKSHFISFDDDEDVSKLLVFISKNEFFLEDCIDCFILQNLLDNQVIEFDLLRDNSIGEENISNVESEEDFITKGFIWEHFEGEVRSLDLGVLRLILDLYQAKRCLKLSFKHLDNQRVVHRTYNSLPNIYNGELVVFIRKLKKLVGRINSALNTNEISSKKRYKSVSTLNLIMKLTREMNELFEKLYEENPLIDGLINHFEENQAEKEKISISMALIIKLKNFNKRSSSTKALIGNGN